MNIPPRLAFLTTVALVLAARTSDANAPAGHYKIGKGAAAGTVYDTKSKLTWQQTVAAATYTWTGAQTYCAALSLNGTGWRVPKEKELFSLLDRSQVTAPLIDSTAFPGTPTDLFWSSSPVAFMASWGWSVDFFGGTTDYAPFTGLQPVRCVR